MRHITRFRGSVAFLLTAVVVLTVAAVTSGITIGWMALALLLAGLVASAVAEGGAGSGRERRARTYPQDESASGG